MRIIVEQIRVRDSSRPQLLAVPDNTIATTNELGTLAIKTLQLCAICPKEVEDYFLLVHGTFHEKSCRTKVMFYNRVHLLP